MQLLESRLSNIVFTSAIAVENYEAVIYAIYFSLKYGFDISDLKVDIALQKDSCLLKCFSWLYYYKRNDTGVLRKLKQHAKQLAENDFDEFWLFIYEALPCEQLKDDWKPMKKAGVSFVKQKYREVIQ